MTRALAGIVVLALSLREPQLEPASDPDLVGGELVHTVVPRDSLTRIGARYGVEPAVLARLNRIGPDSILKTGLRLDVENRHIVPARLESGILINVPQRLLFLFSDGRLAAWYPVGVGRPGWQTATGRFAVKSLVRNPTWHVPASIQAEMRRSGHAVRREVPPGPDNPLGEYALMLDGSPCEIHSTIAPASVYGFRTHGCIRLHPDDMRELFGRVEVGTPVEVIYEPVLMAGERGGAIHVEVHPDAYGLAPPARTAIARLAEQRGVAAELDGALVEAAVSEREGVARRVDRGAR